MNGENKWKKFFLIIYCLIYTVLISGIIFTIFSFPNRITVYNQQQVEQAQNEIQNLIEKVDIAPENEKIALAKTLGRELSAQNNIDIAIGQENDAPILYSNMTDDDVVNFAMLATENVLYKVQDTYIGKSNKQYHISLIIYETNIFSVFYQTLIMLGILVTLLSISTIIGLKYLDFIFMKPLKQLRLLISHLTSFNFKAVTNRNIANGMGERDALSSALQEFALELKEKMHLYGEEYIQLQLQLQNRVDNNEHIKLVAMGLVHDLKTPLNIAIMQLESLEKNKIENNKKDQLIEDIKESNHLMLAEINEVLRILSADNSGQEKRENFDVIMLFKKIISQYRPVFSEKSVIVNSEIVSKLAVIMDKLECKLILNNLLSNASKYVDIGGTVSINIFNENELLYIEVENSTLVAEIDYDQIFSPFYSLDKTSKSKSGIGLNVVKKIVESYEGEIKIFSSEIGVFTRVILPCVGEKEN